MRYSIGDGMADFGFQFLETLHEPIFLVNRIGKIIKINEAGRKFLRVAHLTSKDVEAFAKAKVVSLFNGIGETCERLKISEKSWQLVARSFSGSEFILVEVKKLAELSVKTAEASN
jgi:hypothetical protein